jgi:O-antigen ligase
MPPRFIHLLPEVTPLTKTSVSVGIACTVVFLGVIYGSATDPKLLIEGIIAVAGMALFLAYPTYGLYVLFGLFLIQASPIYQAYGVLANSVTIADIAGILILAGYIYRALSGGDRLSIPPPAQTALLAVSGYFGFSFLSAIWSPASLVAVEQVIRGGLEAIALFALSLVLIRGRRQAQTAAGTYAVVASLTAVWVVFNYSSHNVAAVYNPLLGTAYRGALPTTLNPNGLSILLALGPAFAYLATVQQSARRQLFATFFSFAPVAVAMVILTSREAFIESGCALVAALAVTRGYRNRLLVAAFLGLAVASLAFAVSTNSVPSYFQQRFALASTDNFGGRGPGWQAGLSYFANNPIGGLGMYGYETNISKLDIQAYTGVTSPHSEYIGSLANYGIIGFMLLLAMLALLNRVNVLGTARNPAGVFVSVLLTMSLIAGSLLLEHWLWVAFSIIFCYGLASRTSTDEQEDTAPAVPSELVRPPVMIPTYYRPPLSASTGFGRTQQRDSQS